MKTGNRKPKRTFRIPLCNRVHLAAAILICILGQLLLCVSVRAGERERIPFDIEDIETLLEGNVGSERIEELINNNGVNFILADEEVLRARGASRSIIEAIRRGYKAQAPLSDEMPKSSSIRLFIGADISGSVGTISLEVAEFLLNSIAENHISVEKRVVMFAGRCSDSLGENDQQIAAKIRASKKAYPNNVSSSGSVLELNRTNFRHVFSRAESFLKESPLKAHNIILLLTDGRHDTEGKGVIEELPSLSRVRKAFRGDVDIILIYSTSQRHSYSEEGVIWSEEVCKKMWEEAISNANESKEISRERLHFAFVPLQNRGKSDFKHLERELIDRILLGERNRIGLKCRSGRTKIEPERIRINVNCTVFSQYLEQVSSSWWAWAMVDGRKVKINLDKQRNFPTSLDRGGNEIDAVLEVKEMGMPEVKRIFIRCEIEPTRRLYWKEWAVWEISCLPDSAVTIAKISNYGGIILPIQSHIGSAYEIAIQFIDKSDELEQLCINEIAWDARTPRDRPSAKIIMHPRSPIYTSGIRNKRGFLFRFGLENNFIAWADIKFRFNGTSTEIPVYYYEHPIKGGKYAFINFRASSLKILFYSLALLTSLIIVKGMCSARWLSWTVKWVTNPVITGKNDRWVIAQGKRIKGWYMSYYDRIITLGASLNLGIVLVISFYLISSEKASEILFFPAIDSVIRASIGVLFAIFLFVPVAILLLKRNVLKGGNSIWKAVVTFILGVGIAIAGYLIQSAYPILGWCFMIGSSVFHRHLGIFPFMEKVLHFFWGVSDDSCRFG